MPLSWNEIKSRAVAFSHDWADESSENAEAKSFWDAFFQVFGISRRRIASFEFPVAASDGKGGFIDLLWKGMLVVEHKSRGKDLDRAYTQAVDYFPGLKERDLPKYVLVSDFGRFRLYDLDTGETQEFKLEDLYKNVRLFGFIAGYQTRSFGQEDPVNIEAAERLGTLHDQLKAVGYEGHVLEVFLVRILFCLFADDTGIFERGQFQLYIEDKTAGDGSDLGMHLAQLFQVLNTPQPVRLKNLDEHLSAFPYVNGRLYSEVLPLASFDRNMRETLLNCCSLDWSRISPAIFGSLFQSIMDEKARRNLGAHYTSETNILKALRPLFLDELRTEFERIKRQPKRLFDFHQKLANVRILDPACGCGNFLVIAYREMRLLELDILRQLVSTAAGGHIDVGHLVYVDVDQFYGIEVEEFPAQIAQVALWLTDHQMNMRVSEEFGQYFVRLPLQKAPNILYGNALASDWRALVAPSDLRYIVGNPPFVGKQHQTPAQKAELVAVFGKTKSIGVLDYVACWYRKAAEYMLENPGIRAAFVSTSSITQGEQVGVLWSDLFRFGVRINFAHRTFQWTSEARGRAAVHCVIIGFALEDSGQKWLFDYETPKSEPHAIQAENINPYLVDAPNVLLENRRTPIWPAPEIVFGSMPNDGGSLLLSDEEKNELLLAEPDAEPFIRPFMGADEFLNGIDRWCLWLVGISPKTLRGLPEVRKRVDAVQAYRLDSTRAATRKLAATPTLFGEIRQPSDTYLLLPRHSSENRSYIPIGFLTPDVIAGDSNMIVPHATLYHFGVLSSAMHMSWVRAVCGRLESRYRYSAGIVYNNFPWPDHTEKQGIAIELAAQQVLNARATFPDSTLADLYSPVAMPPVLSKAHERLNKAVDMAYSKTSFQTEAQRAAFLFKRYGALLAEGASQVELV